MSVQSIKLYSTSDFDGVTVCRDEQNREWLAMEPANYVAMMRMLISRATLLDRLRAMRRPSHWLNRAKVLASMFAKEESWLRPT